VTGSVRRLAPACTNGSSQAPLQILWPIVASVFRIDAPAVEEAISDASASALPEVGDDGLGRGQMQGPAQEACGVPSGGAVGEIPAAANHLNSPRTSGLSMIDSNDYLKVMSVGAHYDELVKYPCQRS